MNIYSRNYVYLLPLYCVAVSSNCELWLLSDLYQQNTVHGNIRRVKQVYISVKMIAISL